MMTTRILSETTHMEKDVFEQSSAIFENLTKCVLRKLLSIGRLNIAGFHGRHHSHQR